MSKLIDVQTKTYFRCCFDFLLEAEQEILQSAWNNICRNNSVLICEGWVGFAESSGRTGRLLLEFQ